MIRGLVWGIALSAFRVLYMDGPKLFGGFEGQSNDDICSLSFGLPLTYLRTDEGRVACDAQIEARLYHYVEVALTLIISTTLAALITFCAANYVKKKGKGGKGKKGGAAITAAITAEKTRFTKLKNKECESFAGLAIQAMDVKQSKEERMSKFQMAFDNMNHSVVTYLRAVVAAATEPTSTTQPILFIEAEPIDDHDSE